MATQIAATPVVSGVEAKKILAEANTRRTAASQQGARKIADKFSLKVKIK